MKIVTYNIQYGKGKDEQIDINRIVDEIESADIIALQEIDRFWPRTGMVDQVDQITSRLKDYYWVFGAGVDLHADSISQVNRGARRQFGNMILSRNPIVSSRHHLLPKYGSISDLSIQRSAIEATIQVGSRLLRIYSIHLTHLSSATRLPQISRILEIHENAIKEGFGVSGNLTGFDWESGISSQQVPAEAIFLGDFNCEPDSKEYDLLTGPISDYGGRIINPAGFIDAWIQSGGDPDQGFSSDVKGKPARLDYCFASTAMREQLVSCRVDEAAQGSDHQPLWIDFKDD
ncbi:MAG: endonuclease/exonuclease/phosphatase family metal-dependent hydrolase [Gammaproteobacteria bacterium]|jgi:endonuclease/exonuclease/phosphatase family metal-dependent hydrolase